MFLYNGFWHVFGILTIEPNLKFYKGYSLSKMPNCQNCFISRTFFFQAAEIAALIAAKIACVNLQFLISVYSVPN